VDKAEWRVTFKWCKYKFMTQDHSMENKGNLMCAKQFPFGIRCMYKKCPLIQRKERAESALPKGGGFDPIYRQ